jgi:hypothetical protein
VIVVSLNGRREIEKLGKGVDRDGILRCTYQLGRLLHNGRIGTT